MVFQQQPSKERLNMKNVVSLDKAKELLQAGYPQPDPEFGQVWYDPDNSLVIVMNHSEESGFTRFCGEDGRGYSDKVGYSDFVYAPTSDELLKSMPWAYASFDEKQNLFVVGSAELERNPDIQDNENLAEALATVWIIEESPNIQKP